jgi:hypothetical protein
MKIALDLDGCIRDLMGSLQQTYKLYHPDYKIVEITQWEIAKFFPVEEGIYDWGFREHADEVFFVNAKLFDRVTEGLGMLKSDGHELSLLSYQNTYSFLPTCRFVDYYLKGYFDEIRIIINDTSKKGNGKEDTWYDLYLDDSPHNIITLLDKKKNVVCMNQPWNKDVPIVRVNDMVEFYHFVKGFTEYRRNV